MMMENSSSNWAIFCCQKQNSDISRQNLDNYYSCTFIFCTIHSSKIIFLGGINNEVKKSVKKGNVGMR